MASIFLSHSSKDNLLARRIANDLREAGIQVWLDEWEILVGDSIIHRIQHGLEQAEFIAVLLTEYSVKSGWVEKEWQSKIGQEAANRQVAVLPIRADNCVIPLLLRDKKYADFRQNYALGLSDLLSSIGGHTERRCSPILSQIQISSLKFHNQIGTHYDTDELRIPSNKILPLRTGIPEIDKFAYRFSDISEIKDLNKGVLAQISEIGHRKLDEFNIDNTIQILFETNSVGIHCWSTIKEPDTVIAFFILALITRATCKGILEKKIRGAKQLNEIAFVKKARNAGGIYIMSIVSTNRRYHGYLMRHLKMEINLLLEQNSGIKYIFTRPINAYVASLATKYGFTPISESPSPIYVTTRTKIRFKDKLLYPYESWFFRIYHRGFYILRRIFLSKPSLPLN